MANLVLQQKHVGQHILGSEEGGIARALVVLTRLDDGPDGRLGTSVGIISTLDGNLALDGEQVIIVVDGTNAALIDLVIAGCQAAVADQNRTGQLLIQLGAHLLLQPGHNIETGDVNDVITIHPLLLVHGGGSSRTLQQTEDLLLLEVALDVTLGPSVILGQVGEHGLEAAEGNMMDAIHDSGNPALIVVNNPRGNIKGTVLGEQPLDVIDAMRQERITHGAIALGIGNGSLNVLIGDAVLQAGVRGIVFEHVVRHVSILLVFVTQSLADDGINNLLLLISQLVEYIAHSFLTAGLSGSGLLGIIFSHRGFLLTLGSLIRFGFSVEELEAFAEDKRLTVIIAIVVSIAVNDNIIDECSGIGSCQNKTDFANIAMQHIPGLSLLQLICINAQAVDVSAHYAIPGSLATRCIVKLAVDPNSFRTVPQQAMTQNIFRTVMVMIPDDRDDFAIAIFECVFANGPTIGAFDVIASGPPSEIVIGFADIVGFNHFDFLGLLPR